jgi:protein-serine/threonine kinase
MTQFFTSHSSAFTTERRNFPGIGFTSKKHGDSSNTPLPSKIKNFFRINSSNSNVPQSRESDREKHNSSANNNNSLKSETKSTFRQSRFLPVIGRYRSTTVASEGNPLEDNSSHIAHANPYFAHQGHPALRHHNEGSLPSSPPGTPHLQVDGRPAPDQATAAGKEELARKLRRVASAPNTQGLFANAKSTERPKTAELGKEPLVEQAGANGKVDLTMADTLALPVIGPDGRLPTPGQIRQSAGFRRTYSSNSIKVRNVEVGPGSFDKIKLIGKGDVGKVYLVREKKSGRLYAMKGILVKSALFDIFCRLFLS